MNDTAKVGLGFGTGAALTGLAALLKLKGLNVKRVAMLRKALKPRVEGFRAAVKQIDDLKFTNKELSSLLEDWKTDYKDLHQAYTSLSADRDAKAKLVEQLEDQLRKALSSPYSDDAAATFRSYLGKYGAK